MTALATELDLVSLARAKEHLRVDHAYEDDLITSYIENAMADVSNFMRRNIIIGSEVDYFNWDAVSSNKRAYPLAHPNVVLGSIVVNYYTEADGYTVLAASNYRIDDLVKYPKIILKLGTDFPTNPLDGGNVIKVEYDAGWATVEEVPTPIIHAILLRIGSMYEHREDVLVGNNTKELPMGLVSLLTPYRYIVY